MKQWVVYIVECADGTLYTGITNDIEARIKKHNDGKGAKYTRSRLPVKLMKMFEMTDKSHASREEYRIKQLSRQDKLLLLK